MTGNNRILTIDGIFFMWKLICATEFRMVVSTRYTFNYGSIMGHSHSIKQDGIMG